jgi:hypothetical protein
MASQTSQAAASSASGSKVIFFDYFIFLFFEMLDGYHVQDK